jgi:hypothetical protein
VRRVVLLISVLSALGWVYLIVLASDLFRRMDFIGLIYLVLGTIVVYWIPQLICRLIYWIIDGFKKDKET